MTGEQRGSHPRTTHFGYETISEGDKRARVEAVFDRVARRYDLMNDLMSGGMHRLWKDALVTWLMPPRSRAFRVLDMAGGTGDVAFRIAGASAGAEIVVADVNAAMLDVGRARAERLGLSHRVSFVEADAEDPGFPAASFDAYTVAFGIRNVTRVDRALAAAHGVLRPGGRFLCLEFSPVDTPGLDRLYDLYSFSVIPRLGRVVAGDGDPYRYLVESIRRFPDRETFAGMVRDAGLSGVAVRGMSGGVAVMHSAWRI